MANLFVTLDTLRTRCREEGDFQNSGFISDAELDRYINLAIAELMDFLIALEDHTWEAKVWYWYIPAGYEACFLPCDFYNLVSLEFMENPADNTERRVMRPFMQFEKNVYRTLEWDLANPPRYRIRTLQGGVDSNLKTVAQAYLRPTDALLTVDKSAANNGWFDCTTGSPVEADPYAEPANPFANASDDHYGHYIEFDRASDSDRYLRITYHPHSPELVEDNDVFLDYNGYSDFIVASCVIKMLTKEESDPAAMMARKAETKDRLKSLGPHRDTGAPQVAVDTRRPRHDFYPGRGGS